MPSMLFSDLIELKAHLGIPPNDTSEDKVLNYWIEQISDWFEEILNRKFVYKSRTEYYNGTGTEKLLLRARPVYTTPTIEVYVDVTGTFGASSGTFLASSQLTWGTDFYLDVDQDDGTSRSGILYRRGNFWNKRDVRQRGYLSPFIGPAPGTIKVIYTAGYTVDNLPASFRLAVNMCIARLRSVMPLGAETMSESYEERAISVAISERLKLIALVAPMLYPFRNWRW